MASVRRSIMANTLQPKPLDKSNLLLMFQCNREAIGRTGQPGRFRPTLLIFDQLFFSPAHAYDSKTGYSSNSSEFFRSFSILAHAFLVIGKELV